MTHPDAVHALVEGIRSRASDPEIFGYEVQVTPVSDFRTTGLDELAQALGDESRGRARVEEEEPDSTTVGLSLFSARFGRRTILVAPIEGNAFATGLGRRALVAAARLRANLSTDDDRSDMYLFLVCPPGDEGGPHRRRVLERNEALARTHVWVPGAQPVTWGTEIATVLDRTFLARPAETGSGPSGDLTPLQTELNRLVRADVLTAEQAAQWDAILAGEEDERRDVAAELLAVLDGENE